MPDSSLFPRLGLAAGLAWFAGCAKPKPAPPAPPPDVTVAPVIQKDEAIFAEWIGTLAGAVDAQIRAQVSGYLLRQDYGEGTPVKKGDVLFTIDARNFQSVVEQATANFEKADLDLKRQTDLLKEAAVSRQDFDNATSAAHTAKAALDEARLNVEFTKIVSPIDGVAGIATAQIGDLVGPGSGVLTTVSTLDPIKVYFSISEQSYLDFKKSRPGQPRFPEDLALELILADGTPYPLKGKFFALDRQIDATTGTLRVAGIFPNPDMLLRPGQYARVRAAVRTVHDALEVPQRAVSELQGAYQVMVVDDQNLAHVRAVKIAERVGPDWIVAEGLKPGERIIVEGLQKAKEGGAVAPKPFSPAAPAAR